MGGCAKAVLGRDAMRRAALRGRVLLCAVHQYLALRCGALLFCFVVRWTGVRYVWCSDDSLQTCWFHRPTFPA